MPQGKTARPWQTGHDRAGAAVLIDFGSGAVYTASATYNGHPALIVQYSGVTHKPSGQPAIFQIILDFQDQAVVFQYHTMPATPGATVTVGINGYALNQPDWLVYCQATSGCPPQNGLAARFAVLPRPALAIGITPDDVFPDPGQTITYTLVVANNGAAQANGAVMTNTLPIGLLYAGGPPQASAGSASYLSVARTVRWDGDLPAGGTVAITYAATLTTGEPIYNTAVVTHPQAANVAGATSAPTQQWGDAEIIESANAFGSDTLAGWRNIAVDSAGAPHIAYAGRGLYATFSGTIWLREQVDPVSASSAALVLRDDRASIAYVANNQLRLAQQVSVSGSLSWTVQAIASFGSWTLQNKIDLQRGGDGRLHIAYNSGSQLYYTVYSGTTWLTPTPVITSGACSLSTWGGGWSLAIDAGNTPRVICPRNGDIPPYSSPYELRLYTYTANAPWTSYEVITSGTSYYYYPSLTYDGDISFRLASVDRRRVDDAHGGYLGSGVQFQRRMGAAGAGDERRRSGAHRALCLIWRSG